MANNIGRVQIQLRDIETNGVRVIGTDGIIDTDGRHSQKRAARMVAFYANGYVARMGGVYFDGWVYRLYKRDYLNVFTGTIKSELV